MTTLGRLARYYEQRYAQPPGALRDYRAYLDLIAVDPGARALDIGCGEGFFLAEAALAGLQPVGVEIVERALHLARDRVPSAQLAVAAGEALPFADGSMDLVTCLGSLEHFADPETGAREVARVLRPDGQALIVVPNRRFVAWALPGRRGTEQQEVSELLLDRQGWSTLLEAAGLRVVRCSREPWHTKPFRSMVKRLAVRMAWAAIPLDRTYQFAFLCTKG